MRRPSLLGWFSPYTVPVCVFCLVAAIAVVVPLLVADTITLRRAYLLTLVFLILAVSYNVAYAAFVAVVTLPVLWTGIAGYASPESAPGDGDAVTIERAVHHVTVGAFYALSSAFVGSLFIGLEFVWSPIGGGFGVPGGAFVGGLLVGGAYVTLQLWRYRTLDGSLEPRTTTATVLLGALLVLSPVVTYWLFDGSSFGV